ncbi:MAG: hypothetical protein JWN86_523 [Planctomycetota bacterium]|nr:hypothetical protein [Planctomycetota bacterium]
MFGGCEDRRIGRPRSASEGRAQVEPLGSPSTNLDRSTEARDSSLAAGAAGVPGRHSQERIGRERSDTRVLAESVRSVDARSAIGSSCDRASGCVAEDSQQQTVHAHFRQQESAPPPPRPEEAKATPGAKNDPTIARKAMRAGRRWLVSRVMATYRFSSLSPCTRISPGWTTGNLTPPFMRTCCPQGPLGHPVAGFQGLPLISRGARQPMIPQQAARRRGRALPTRWPPRPQDWPRPPHRWDVGEGAVTPVNGLIIVDKCQGPEPASGGRSVDAKAARAAGA